MRRFLIVLLMVAFCGPCISQERNISLAKKKNLVGIGHNYINTVEGIWSGRYGRNIFNKVTLGLDLGFEHFDSHKSYEYTSYFGGPYIRYYFLDRKFSPIAELNYKLWTLEDRESGKQKVFNGDLLLEVGCIYNGILKNRISIEYLIGIGRTWQFDPSWNGYDFSVILRVNFHFPK